MAKIDLAPAITGAPKTQAATTDVATVHPVIACAQWLTRGALSQKPPPRPWLLQGEDGATGLIPRGEVGLVVGAGGVSKTYVMISLAIAVALGKPWLDAYPVAHDADGHVALFLAEEDQAECCRRLIAVANAMGLTEQERRKAEERIMIAPLKGVEARLVRQSGSYGRVTNQRSAAAEAIQKHLSESADSWSLLVFDALSRFGGPDTEVSNASGADFVRILEDFAKLPGSPTIACVHHTNQSSRDAGKGVGTTAARGVTVLTDNSRWILTLAENDRGLVDLKLTKANYGPRFPALPALQLKQRLHGAVTAATEAEIAIASATAEIDRRDAEADRRERIEVALLAEARKHPERYTSKTKLVETVAGNKTEKLNTVNGLIAEGRIEFTKSGCRVTEGA